MTENVAVKLFLKCSMTQLQHLSLGQILKGLNEPTQLLNAYQEIRQEVSFISNLSHPNLTRLCGVRTNPYLCLILEMAPGKSLDIILKEYYDCGEVLEPVTLKESALQVNHPLQAQINYFRRGPIFTILLDLTAYVLIEKDMEHMPCSFCTYYLNNTFFVIIPKALYNESIFNRMNTVSV